MTTLISSIIEKLIPSNGTQENVQLAQKLKELLWQRYDPNDDLIYPTVSDWDDLLLKTMKRSSYDELTRDEVLSVLFGLIHRNRIVEGLWWSMFERGVSQELLKRLLALDSDKH